MNINDIKVGKLYQATKNVTIVKLHPNDLTRWEFKKVEKNGIILVYEIQKDPYDKKNRLIFFLYKNMTRCTMWFKKDLEHFKEI